MQKVFLSYASQDRQAVDQLARELFQQGISYWRDQDKLYTGQRWPKELGEAIAAQDCVLLVWSKQAAESYYVEMEWCTAVALKKTILPCRLDNTSLPPSLASVQTADLRDGTAVSQIITAFQSPKTLPDPLVEAEVITKLAAINTNYAMQAGLMPSKNGLIVEDGDSPYANLLVVRSSDKNDPRFLKLVAALHSPEVLHEAQQLFHGQAVRAWK